MVFHSGFSTDDRVIQSRVPESNEFNEIMKPAEPLDWQSALTFNAEALARVDQAIDESDAMMVNPTRHGC
ncbi:MAG: hypothetical protein ACOYN7_06945 [Candidatus Nanopelagicales bacterium]